VLNLSPSANGNPPCIGHSVRVNSGHSSQTTTSNDSAPGSHPLSMPDCLDAMELFLRPPTAKKAAAPRSQPAHPLHGNEAPHQDHPTASLSCALNASDSTAVQGFQRGPRSEGTRQSHLKSESIKLLGQASASVTASLPPGAQTCIAADEFTLTSSFALPIIPAGAVQTGSSAVHTASNYNPLSRFTSSMRSHAPLSATRQAIVLSVEGSLGVTGRTSLSTPSVYSRQVDLSRKVGRNFSLGEAHLASQPWANVGPIKHVTKQAWGWGSNRPSLGAKNSSMSNPSLAPLEGGNHQPQGGGRAGLSQAARLVPGVHPNQLGQVVEASIHADIASYSGMARMQARARAPGLPGRTPAACDPAWHTPAALPHVSFPPAAIPHAPHAQAGEPARPADLVARDLASTSSSASSVCAAELLSCRRVDIGAMRRAERPCDTSSSARAAAGGIRSSSRPMCTPRVIYKGGSIAACEMASNYAGRGDSSLNHGNALLMVCEGGTARPRATEAAARAPPPHMCNLTPNHLSHVPPAASSGGTRELPREGNGGGRMDKAAGAWAQWFAPTHALEVST